MSSNLNIQKSSPKNEVGGRWDGPDGSVLVDIRRSNNARDIRDTLVSLAYVLSEDGPKTSALCVVPKSRLSLARLAKELEQFRQVLIPDLASRIHVATLDETGQLKGSPYDTDLEFLRWANELVANDSAPVSIIRSNRQSVASMLTQLWLRNEGPQSFKALQHLCKASYPTVSIAVKDLSEKGFVKHQTDRSVELSYLTNDVWLTMFKAHSENRKVLRFIDPTGQPRSPESMAKRLFKLQEQDLFMNAAVGGVLGAKHYFPDLDITASPRLDISVYGKSAEFVAKIDAALEQTTNPQAKAVLVVHLVQGPANFMERHANETWAPEMECLADLYEMGLTREAMEMVASYPRKGKAEKEGAEP